jgi:hypothetical protein
MGTAEIGQIIWTRSSYPQLRTGMGPKSSNNLGTSRATGRPRSIVVVTPVTVPVIQTSSAQPGPSHSPRRKGTIADPTGLQSQACRWAKALPGNERVIKP